MSRFNNIKAVFATAPKPDGEPEQRPAPMVNAPGGKQWAGARTQAAAAAPKAREARGDRSLGQAVGFLVLCIYLVSGYANEFAVRALGVKAYISTVALAILPVALLVSGNLFRGLRDTVGWLWLGFIGWICLTIPFSLWRGGSVALLEDYATHSWVFFFLITAFAVSVKHCRWLMMVLIAANFLLLLDCAVASHISSDGRLDIPDSVFFENANDLSLQLGLAITQFFYLLFQEGVWRRALAVVGITAALMYSLQTGSRGGALSILVLVAVIFVVGNHKLLMGVAVLVAGIAAVAIVPADAFHRISLISGDEPMADTTDLGAMGSRAQRLELLRQSLAFTITNPLFGVGPGQFPVAVNGEAEKVGKRAPWLGTHNSYTEVSSECGIPAFLMYTGVLFICLWSNLRLFQRSKGQPQWREVNAVAFCMFSGCLVYAVATFFHHIAYSSYLPQLSGISVALRLSVNRSLLGARRVFTIGGAPNSAAGRLAKGAA